ncbi:RNA polymerase sigma factor rpoD, putative [Babesia ovata]|uniref:RNA polymerase sigma factor rpoD, putative n=1 Tax=Babesia ovata TaxID=189622 RepID=A0A2H6K885_9APIC|nr:RNA polymerase sigma factor rpoD, putative [Babesia ovata]GBE59207.1 RNA polymerase sigma factor rpoD, putative [Babesia ovata]
MSCRWSGDLMVEYGLMTVRLKNKRKTILTRASPCSLKAGLRPIVHVSEGVRAWLQALEKKDGDVTTALNDLKGVIDGHMWEIGSGGQCLEEAVKAEKTLGGIGKNVGDMISSIMCQSIRLLTMFDATVNDDDMKCCVAALRGMFTRQRIEVKRRIEEEMQEMQETLKHKSNNISTYIYDSMHTEEDKIESTKRAVDATKTLDETQVRTPVPRNDPRSTQVLG